MYFSGLLKNCAAAGFLGFTVFSILATSVARDGDAPYSGNQYIMSDCVTPTRDANITIIGGSISSPGGLTFLDFGFPSTVLKQTVSGVVGLVNRECTVTYGEDGHNNVENRWLYSCFDNGVYKCSIYIGPNY